MKKIVILLLILVLCACSTSSNIFNELDSTFTLFSTNNEERHNNNNTKYYNFYLPSDVNEMEYDNIFHHLVFNCSDFVMNLNINNIMSENVFNSDADDPYSFMNEYSIYMFDSSNTNSESGYVFNIYYYNDQYFFSFYSKNLSFFGKTVLSDTVELAKRLLVINSSVSVDTSKVIDDYYSGTAIDFTKEQVNLFDTYHSSEGQLSDLLPD